jgi:hypothetical protein
MKSALLTGSFLTLLLAQGIPGQVIDPKPAATGEKIRAEAVAFLRETLGDVANMRTIENRISFTADLAALMWYRDEKEARSMFTSVARDFKELMMQYDSEINALAVKTDGEEEGYGGLLGGGSGSVRIYRKIQKAMGVRQQIAGNIAEHEPEMALNFFRESISGITNPQFREDAKQRDSSFEGQLLAKVAESNPAKAVELGKASLEKGFTFQHVDLLRKIYAKDAEKGIEFGSSLRSRAAVEKVNHSFVYVLASLLDFGSETLDASVSEGGKKPVFTRDELRELAELLARTMLDSDIEDYGMVGYAATIEKFAPARAAQLRAKFGNASPSLPQSYAANTNRSVVNAMNAAANNFTSSTPPPPPDAAEREREARALAEQKLMDDVLTLGTKDLPKEERDRIVSQTRKLITGTPNLEKKLIALSGLAAQVRKAGDKELAAELMSEAASLVNPNPKNYRDFLVTWMLVSGYAEADPDKAYTLLEDTIMRANDMISAFVRVGEFIDVDEEMIVDGEVQLGAFGGRMLTGVTKEFGVAEGTIDTLVKHDFTKTQALTNRFERPEVRVLSKLLVLRAVLGKKPSTAGEVEEKGIPATEVY